MKKMGLTLLLSSLILSTAWAEAPVYFADATLKGAVEEELWVLDPTPTDMLALTGLECLSCGVSDLTGLEYATNLCSLYLRKNNVSDLSPLSGLTSLESLVLEVNQISDISALSGLVNLQELSLIENQISDVSSLSGLTNLRSLSLHRNEVSDISSLTALTSLDFLDLRINPLNRDAYSTYIPEITANNPGITIWYDPTYERHLTVSSTAGGKVIQPGEGDFTYEYREAIWLEAKADPCFVFVKWTGTYATTRNPLLFTVTEDHHLRANFLSLRDVIHVDDDAPGDLGPGNSLLGDPSESGAPDHPLDTIQEAVDVAGDGVTIVVRPGIYRENIELSGKSVRLLGYDPNDPDSSGWPVIDGGNNGPTIHMKGHEGSTCELTGFVITGGRANSGGAILCSGGSPRIVNCLVAGNRATDVTGGTVSCVDSNAMFVNCTFTDNHGGSQGAGFLVTNNTVTFVDSILWGNTPQEILATGSAEVSVHHSNVAGGWPGSDNADVDPLFAGTGYWVDRGYPDVVVEPDYYNALWVMGDYHLQSQAGRWDPQMSEWVLDAATSPCIDAGDPATPAGCEPVPNGGIINMGAYGGTLEASRSPDRF
jgi:hypothetical protein